MARPIASKKQTVPLASAPVRVSRIRRDPPPKAKAEAAVDTEERERWAVTVGVLAFALSIFVIVLAAGSYSGWSPTDYTMELNAAE